MSGILLSLPNNAAQEIWQNGHSTLAAMAEHPVFRQQNIVHDVIGHPVLAKLLF